MLADLGLNKGKFKIIFVTAWVRDFVHPVIYYILMVERAVPSAFDFCDIEEAC